MLLADISDGSINQEWYLHRDQDLSSLSHHRKADLNFVDPYASYVGEVIPKWLPNEPTPPEHFDPDGLCGR